MIKKIIEKWDDMYVLYKMLITFTLMVAFWIILDYTNDVVKQLINILLPL